MALRAARQAQRRLEVELAQAHTDLQLQRAELAEARSDVIQTRIELATARTRIEQSMVKSEQNAQTAKSLQGQLTRKQNVLDNTRQELKEAQRSGAFLGGQLKRARTTISNLEDKLKRADEALHAINDFPTAQSRFPDPASSASSAATGAHDASS